MSGPMSPCISVCSLDIQGYCAGCLRTRDEIAGWMRMSATDQWALIRRLEERRAQGQQGHNDTVVRR
jgi:predicted Fe-S protein YdhL (DUF1289 family)